MTEMRRISIAIPDALDSQILELRKQDEYVRLTYSEIIRRLLCSAVERAMPDALDSTDVASSA